MINLKNKLNNIYICSVLFFILGSIFVFGFPPYGYFVSTIVSIILASAYLRVISGFKFFIISLLSYVLGISLFGFYWIYYSILYVFPNYILAGIIFIGFVLLYSLFLFLTWIIIYNSKHLSNNLAIIVIFMAWAIYEVAKEYLFPWFPMAQIWDFNLPILQIISVIGVLGLSILTMMIVFSVKYIFLIKKNYFRFVPFLLSIMCFIGIYIYGYNKISNYKPNYNNKVSLRLINTNINQAEKYSQNQQDKIFTNTVNLINKNRKNKSFDYIILPEVAFGFVLEDYDYHFNKIKQEIPSNSKLILGVLRKDINGYYNSMYIIDGETKEVVYSYDKNRLVPFGEYMPFVANFAGLEGLQKGNKTSAYIDNKISINPAICFEGVFEAKIDNSTTNSLLLTIGNEAWFDDSIEKVQMLSLFKLRVIQAQVVGVKVSNRGQSGIIDKLGRYIYISDDAKENIVDIDIYL